jgi:hypothetical protein
MENVPPLKKNNKGIAVGQGHPAFSDDRIDAETIPSSDVFDLRKGFVQKLYGVLPGESSDPGAMKANKAMWPGCTMKRAEQGAEPMACDDSADMKAIRKGDCSSWGHK